MRTLILGCGKEQRTDLQPLHNRILVLAAARDLQLWQSLDIQSSEGAAGGASAWAAVSPGAAPTTMFSRGWLRTH
jgi:hypothetical protein